MNTEDDIDEALALIRVVRSDERRIWKIFPEKKPKKSAEEYIQEILERFRKNYKSAYNPETGCIEGITEDISWWGEQPARSKDEQELFDKVMKEYFMIQNLKFKKLHEDAVLPFYGSEFAGGMDCVTVTDPIFEDTYVCYKLGFAMEVPTGHVGLLFPRSSNSKMDLLLSNSVGVIDEDYRGEVQARFKDTFMPRGLFVGMDSGIEPKYYKKGDAVCQLIIIPVSRYEAMWADELSDTVRGDGGFGSTNK